MQVLTDGDNDIALDRRAVRLRAVHPIDGIDASGDGAAFTMHVQGKTPHPDMPC